MSDENKSDEFEEIVSDIIDQVIELIDKETAEENQKLIDELAKNDKNNLPDPLLNKSIRLINLEEFELSPSTSCSNPRIGTRSQKNIQHTEFIPAKRAKNKKMAENNIEQAIMSFSEALVVIPYYSGETDIHHFISTCENALNLIDKTKIPLLVKTIASSKLTKKAYNVTKYKEINNWQDIKNILLENFEVSYSASNLQTELSMIRMRETESVRSYNNRVEDIFQKLCLANNKDSVSDSDAAAVRRNMKIRALEYYLDGLDKELRMEVKIKNPGTLEEAMQAAVLCEKHIQTYNAVQERIEALNKNDSEINKTRGRPDQKIDNYRNRNRNNNYYNTNNGQDNNNYNTNNQNSRQNNNNYRNNNNHRNNNNNLFNNRANFNGNNKRCFTCNREGHIASQCRSNNNQRNYNTYTKPVTNYNARNVACEYCNRSGHDISTCYTKQNDERKNKNTNQESGNLTGSPVTPGARAINQITSVEQSEIATTSYQQ